MTLKQMLSVFARRWGLLAVACAACIGAAGAYLSLVGPTYSARADILITPVAADRAIADTGVVVESIESIRSIQTAAVLINTDEAAVRTAARMGDGWTPQMVIDAVDIAPRGQSSVVSITATASESLDASDLATIFATEALAVRDEDVRQRSQTLIEDRDNGIGSDDLANLDSATLKKLETELAELRLLAANGDPSMTLVNQAAGPRTPSSPSPVVVLVLAAFLGPLIGGALSLALEQLGSRPQLAAEQGPEPSNSDWAPPTVPYGRHSIYRPDTSTTNLSAVVHDTSGHRGRDGR